MLVREAVDTVRSMLTGSSIDEISVLGRTTSPRPTTRSACATRSATSPSARPSRSG